jgi:membrane-associated phospholipid phosphatase
MCLSVGVGPAAAQTSLLEAASAAAVTGTLDEQRPSPALSQTNFFTDLVGDFKRFPSKETATLLGVGAAAAMLGHSVDQPVSHFMIGSTRLGAPLEPGNVIGGSQVQFGAALATYTLGKINGSPRVASLGSDLLRAQLLSQVVTGAVKVAAQRTRPDGTNLSFPSGHTSVTFASATVLQRHFGWKVGIPAYGVAAYVAAARIQESRHFLSDVAFGAAIGLAAGRTVTIGRGDARFAMAPVAAAGGAGVSFTWLGR